MPSDGDALLKVICERPREDTPRLMYADWLDEHGDRLRADFIRFQIEFPRWSTSHPRYAELSARDDTFESARPKWIGMLAHPSGVKYVDPVGWDRGFMAWVQFRNTKVFVESAGDVFSATPVTTLDVSGVTGGTVDRVLGSPLVARVKRLFLHGELGPRVALEIATCARLSQLETLHVWGGCPDAGAESLAASPNLGALKVLSFSGHTLSDRGLLALVDSAALAALSRVVLNGAPGISKRVLARAKRRFAELVV
jgi:uncharacterized protein (TIGR02996 family)